MIIVNCYFVLHASSSLVRKGGRAVHIYIRSLFFFGHDLHYRDWNASVRVSDKATKTQGWPVWIKWEIAFRRGVFRVYRKTWKQKRERKTQYNCVSSLGKSCGCPLPNNRCIVWRRHEPVWFLRKKLLPNA